MTQCDVLVVGAGPAGIAAATAAAISGRRVLLLDENPAPGGQIWRVGQPMPKGQAEGQTAKNQAIARLCACGASCLFGYSVYDAPSAGELRAICESGEAAAGPVPGDPHIVGLRYEKLILATGARERFLPFPGWTLPGVFGPGGLQALVKGGFNVAGQRIVVAGSGPLLLAVAAHLRGYGANVVCVAEQAPLAKMLPFAASLWSHPARILQGIQYRAALGTAPFHLGCWPVAALADEVSGKLTGVRLTNGKRTWTQHCDLLACGFHLVPNIELASLLGCAIQDGFVKVDHQQRTSLAHVYCAGEPTGIGGLGAALVQGEIAGLASAGKPTDSLQGRRLAERKFALKLEAAFRIRPELRSLARPDTLVCRCEDIPYAALEKRSGWIDAKLQTRCGMGPCQGRICGAATETLFGWKQTSVRPPLMPVPVSALVYPGLQPVSLKEHL